MRTNILIAGHSTFQLLPPALLTSSISVASSDRMATSTASSTEPSLTRAPIERVGEETRRNISAYKPHPII